MRQNTLIFSTAKSVLKVLAVLVEIIWPLLFPIAEYVLPLPLATTAAPICKNPFDETATDV